MDASLIADITTGIIFVGTTTVCLGVMTTVVLDKIRERKDHMNLNQLAKELTEAEGLKVQISIAQVKEVLRLVGERLLEAYEEDCEESDVYELLLRNARKNRKKKK